jgi:hypothetical protein
VLHSGEGDGWDPDRPAMASIIIFQGKVYLIDAGPNIRHTLNALGISVNEAAAGCRRGGVGYDEVVRAALAQARAHRFVQYVPLQKRKIGVGGRDPEILEIDRDEAARAFQLPQEPEAPGAGRGAYVEDGRSRGACVFRALVAGSRIRKGPGEVAACPYRCS